MYDLCGVRDYTVSRLTERSAEWDVNVAPPHNVVSRVPRRVAGVAKLTAHVTDFNTSNTDHQACSTNQLIQRSKTTNVNLLADTLMFHSVRTQGRRKSRTPAVPRVCQRDNEQMQAGKHLFTDCPLSARCRARLFIL